MRTLLIILGIWLLINVLFVVVMIPPRKPRAGRLRGALRPAQIRTDGSSPQQDAPVSLRHVVIAIALGIFFSLTPPLLEGYDALRRWVGRLTRLGQGLVRSDFARPAHGSSVELFAPC